ncbi:PTS glucose transporter subunit IIA [Streptomyces sp. NPDC006553]|uniref:PTS sugar transporter subunit IIA n=1 Tax=Streptomyces sp. NPDC006553 TaxID=3157180 RepID=UPI0033B566A3
MPLVSAPLDGRAVGLVAVPDPVFARLMVGPGTAIDPVREPTEAVSPLDGVVISLYHHAYAVMDAEGHGVLTHLGIDTVELKGGGFEAPVKKGDRVTRGQGVIRWNPAAVEAAGQAPISPVVATDATADRTREVIEDAHVTRGEALFTWA